MRGVRQKRQRPCGALVEERGRGGESFSFRKSEREGRNSIELQRDSRSRNNQIAIAERTSDVTLSMSLRTIAVSIEYRRGGKKSLNLRLWRPKCPQCEDNCRRDTPSGGRSLCHPFTRRSGLGARLLTFFFCNRKEEKSFDLPERALRDQVREISEHAHPTFEFFLI